MEDSGDTHVFQIRRLKHISVVKLEDGTLQLFLK